MSLPRIDLTCWSDPAGTFEARAAAATALDKACASVGFFYMHMPGLAEASDRLLQRCREFHGLPGATKQLVASSLSPLYRGFNATWQSGGGSCAAKPGIDPPDPKEVFMLGAEGDASPMHGPNQWPSEEALPGWRAAVTADMATMFDATKVLAAALAAALGEPEGTFDEALRQPPLVLILLRYDAARLASGSTTGCGAHTDCGWLTLLAQEPGSTPLQVQRGAADAGREFSTGAAGVDECAWVEAPPLPAHVLVNLGDMLHRWTVRLAARTTCRQTSLSKACSAPHSCGLWRRTAATAPPCTA